VRGQATVGGPFTALALAISKRWSALVTPSVLLGVLGYATGNHIGGRDSVPDPVVHRVAGRAEVSARVRRPNPRRPDLSPPT
jgi:hypothetical protein